MNNFVIFFISFLHISIYVIFFGGKNDVYRLQVDYRKSAHRISARTHTTPWRVKIHCSIEHKKRARTQTILALKVSVDAAVIVCVAFFRHQTMENTHRSLSKIFCAHLVVQVQAKSTLNEYIFDLSVIWVFVVLVSYASSRDNTPECVCVRIHAPQVCKHIELIVFGFI